MTRSAFKASVYCTVFLCLATGQAFSIAARSQTDEPLPLRFAEDRIPSARIDALVESLIVGRWEIDTRDPGQEQDPQYRYRWVFHFSPDHTVEMRIWLKNGYAGSEGDPPVYFGLVQKGAWFIHGGRIGIVSRQCHGLTTQAQLECSAKAYGIGDTSYQILQRQDDEVYLSSGASSPVRFAFKGRDRDMSTPDFWPAGVSLHGAMRKVRIRPGIGGQEMPPFKAKGPNSPEGL